MKITLTVLITGSVFVIGLVVYIAGIEAKPEVEKVKVVVTSPFDYAGNFSDGLGLVRNGRQKNEKSYYIDHHGDVVLMPEFEGTFKTFHFSEGLASVLMGFTDYSYYNDGKWGFMDRTGRLIVEPWFDYASSFSQGLAMIRMGPRKGGKWGFINKAGEIVMQPQFSSARDFQGGCAVVSVGGTWKDGQLTRGRWAFADKFGKLTFVPSVDYLGNFSDGLAIVQVGKKWGFVDRAGKLAIESKFYQVRDFSQGRAAFEKRPEDSASNGRWGYIDKSGTIVVEPKFFMADKFSEGLAAVIEGSPRKGFCYKYIDANGNVVIETKYNLARRFSEGLACVAIGKLYESSKGLDTTWGYIDKIGRTVIEPQFDSAEDFCEGIASVLLLGGRGRYSYIDRSGKFISAPDSANTSERTVAD